MRRVRSLLVLVPMSIVAIAAPLATEARAAFPGANGLLAYASVNANNGCPDIFTALPDGTGKTKLTSCPAVATDPRWNAGGSEIAFASTTVETGGGPGPLEIYTMGSTGGGLLQITNDAVEDDDPSWNADGSVIVEGRTRSGPSTEDIATVSAGGGTPAILVDGSAGSEAGEPQFSPDGTRIAFQQRNGPVVDVFTMNANGSNIVDVTPGNDGNSEYPSWSPDGHFLAFASDRFGVFELFVVDVSGGPNSGQVFQITDETSVPDIQPAWSPDQSTIVYTHGCASDGCQGQGGPENGDIYSVDVADLTDPQTPLAVVATANAEFDPDWGVACSSNCGPTHAQRSVSLTLRGHLKALGRITDESGQNNTCVVKRKVQIQRRSGAAWKTVKTATSDNIGMYSILLDNRSGTYRAVAVEVDLSQTKDLICDEATSMPRSYTATHTRVFVDFFVGQSGPNSLGSVADIKATDGYTACVAHMPIQIQRKAGSSWVLVRTEKTGAPRNDGQAGYMIGDLPKVNGTYRGYAPQKTLSSGDVCKAATSKTWAFPPTS